MKIEAAGSAPEFESQETEPSIPEDPTEAASWLQEVWKGNGGWQSLHPLRLKVKGPDDYQALSEEEKLQFDQLGRQFAWLAEMYRSEMSWAQSYARTNYGEVIGFRFGCDIPDEGEELVPEAYVFRPFNKDNPEVFVSMGEEGWKMQPLKDVMAKYEESFAN